MSKEFRAIERNRERLGLNLSEAQFDEEMARRKRIGRRVDVLVGALAVFIIAVCLYDPLAETLVAVVQFAVKALESLS